MDAEYRTLFEGYIVKLDETYRLFSHPVDMDAGQKSALRRAAFRQAATVVQECEQALWNHAQQAILSKETLLTLAKALQESHHLIDKVALEI